MDNLLGNVNALVKSAVQLQQLCNQVPEDAQNELESLLLSQDDQQR